MAFCFHLFFSLFLFLLFPSTRANRFSFFCGGISFCFGASAATTEYATVSFHFESLIIYIIWLPRPLPPPPRSKCKNTLLSTKRSWDHGKTSPLPTICYEKTIKNQKNKFNRRQYSHIHTVHTHRDGIIHKSKSTCYAQKYYCRSIALPLFVQNHLYFFSLPVFATAEDCCFFSHPF